MTISETYSFIRIIPRESDFLDRKSGSRGEIFYDRDSNTLRLYNGTDQGGVSLAKNDLTNVSNSVFADKATAAGVGGGGGNTTVSVGASLPTSPSSGNLWLNTNNGSLYVYINDGDSNQWIQPAFSTPNLTDYATKAYVDSAVADLPRSQLEFYVAADDSTQRKVNNGNLVQFIGAGGVTTSSDADGNITITGGGTTGNVTFATTTIDTTDSSAIIFTPAVTFNSDVTVENELFVSNNITADKFIGTLSWSNVSDTPTTLAGYGITDLGTFTFAASTIDTTDSSSITVTPAAIFNSDITVENELFVNNIASTGNTITLRSASIVIDGIATFNKTTEIVNSISGATGTVVHDFSGGSLFLHTSIVANFTANFINVPTTDGRSITVALILDQGATAYIPNAVQIAGASQTIKWSGGSEPSGTNNYTDIVNFTLIRSGGAWTVLGSLSTYN